jgi:hypothetical protein
MHSGIRELTPQAHAHRDHAIVSTAFPMVMIAVLGQGAWSA